MENQIKTMELRGISKTDFTKTADQVVFVNQLTVSTPEFLGKIRGFLPHEQYKYATVFLDYYSNVCYVVFQRALEGRETVNAKAVYECYARLFGIKVQHYHTNNGNYSDCAFMGDVRSDHQA